MTSAATIAWGWERRLCTLRRSVSYVGSGSPRTTLPIVPLARWKVSVRPAPARTASDFERRQDLRRASLHQRPDGLAHLVVVSSLPEDGFLADPIGAPWGVSADQHLGIPLANRTRT